MATYNVVKEYPWTSVPNGSKLREEAPRAEVTSFELTQSQLRAFVSGYLNVFNANKNNDPTKFIDDLYQVKQGSETEYIFPFFENTFRGYTNDYADTFSQISQRGAQMMGAGGLELAGGLAEEAGFGGLSMIQQSGNQKLQNTVQKGFNATQKGGQAVIDFVNNKFGTDYSFPWNIPEFPNPGEFPGSYVETPKFYQYAQTDGGVSINFVLANTINEGDIEKNQKLIENIIKESRPRRATAIAMSFPRIYTVEIPGLRYIRWAYLAQAAFNLMGQRRIIDKRIVPEAYAITLTFNSLTIETANFLEEAKMAPK